MPPAETLGTPTVLPPKVEQAALVALARLAAGNPESVPDGYGDGNPAPPEELEARTALDEELSSRFLLAQEACKEIQDQLLASRYRRDGRYQKEVLEKLTRSGGSRAFDNATEGKCAAAQAQLCNLVLFGRTKPWKIQPTPIPDLPPHVRQSAIRTALLSYVQETGRVPDPADPVFLQNANDIARKIFNDLRQEAELRAERMQRLIHDQFEEAHWFDVFLEFAYDFVTFEVAGIMGPMPQYILKPVVQPDNSIRYERSVVLSMECMNPFGIYPAAMSEKVADGDFFYRKLISDDTALELRVLPNLIPDSFRRAYARRGQLVADGHNDLALAEHEKNMGKTGEVFNADTRHELIYWWHRMSRREAAGARREEVPDGEDPDERIPYMGLMLNGVVITLEPNWDRTGKPQVHLACFRKVPRSLFGKGVAGLMKGAQDDRNVARRALNTNILFSAQLSRIIYPQLLENPMSATVSFPGQCYVGRLSNMPNDSRRPIEPVETPNNTNALLLALRQADESGDDQTGIYPQAYGSNRQVGPAQTASGYSQLREDQAVTLKLAVANMESCIRSLVEHYWLWNMCSTKTPENCKGDQKVVASGAVKLFLDTDNEVILQNLFRMFMESFQVVQPYLTDTAIANLLRRLLEIVGGDPDSYIKPADEIQQETAKLKQQIEQQEALAQQAQQAQIAQQMGQGAPQGSPQPSPGSMPADPNSPDFIKAQAALIKAQADMKRANVEEQRLLIDAQTASSDIQHLQAQDASLLAGAQGANRPTAPASASSSESSGPQPLTEAQIQNTPSIPELMQQGAA